MSTGASASANAAADLEPLPLRITVAGIELHRDEQGRLVDGEGRVFWRDATTLPGTTRIRWSSASVWADDGEGTRPGTHGAAATLRKAVLLSRES